MSKFANLATVEQELHKCMKCGNCQAVCPVYKETNSEAGVARGKIRLAEGILSGELAITPELTKRMDLCLACKACAANCPCGVKFEEIILAAREEIAKAKAYDYKKLLTEPWKSPLAFKVTANRKLFHGLLRFMGKASKPITKGQPMMRHLPLVLSELTSWRSLPAITDKPFRDRFAEYKQQVPKLKGKVIFYSGCAIDFAFPEVGMSVVKVLNKRGYEVLFPMDQGCCGTPLRYSGDIKPVKKMAKANIAALESAEADFMITACPTCMGSWVHDYPELLKDEPQWLARAQAIKDKTREFCQFLVGNTDLPQVFKGVAGQDKIKATYHDSCHMKRHLEIIQEPRDILKSISGIEFVEMPKADSCCGCGGSFSLKFPEVSAGIMGKKVDNIQKSAADLVVTACPGCLMQIKGGLDKLGKSIQAKHIAEVLAEREL